LGTRPIETVFFCRHKFAATTDAVVGTLAVIGGDLEQQYRALVERARRPVAIR
jgi:hypothetical protein